MPWWGWIVLGVVLLGSEVVVTTDFYLVILGAAAIAVGGLTVTGLVETVWLQWLLFALASVVFLVVFRQRLHALTASDEDESEELLGEVATTRDAIAPGDVGRVELRGSIWSARNTGASALVPATRVRVCAVDGLELRICAEHEHGN